MLNVKLSWGKYVFYSVDDSLIVHVFHWESLDAKFSQIIHWYTIFKFKMYL